MKHLSIKGNDKKEFLNIIYKRYLIGEENDMLLKEKTMRC